MAVKASEWGAMAAFKPLAIGLKKLNGNSGRFPFRFSALLNLDKTINIFLSK